MTDKKQIRGGSRRWTVGKLPHVAGESVPEYDEAWEAKLLSRVDSLKEQLQQLYLSGMVLFLHVASHFCFVLNFYSFLLFHCVSACPFVPSSRCVSFILSWRYVRFILLLLFSATPFSSYFFFPIDVDFFFLVDIDYLPLLL